MKPLLSEFSYGYALTEELVTMSSGVTAAPLFPSLYQEGQVGGGFDVMLPYPVAPIFLQFKLADFMGRRSASEWQLFGAAYYRMHLRPRRFSRQHALLLNLQAPSRNVYYVAPHFHQTWRLNWCYLNRQVATWSIFVPPSAIGPLPNDADHYVAFLQEKAYFCSRNPKLLDYDVSGHHHAELFSRLAQSAERKADRRFFLSILDEMQEVLGGDAKDDPILMRIESQEFRTEASVLQIARTAGYLARVRFGAELILLGRKPLMPAAAQP